MRFFGPEVVRVIRFRSPDTENVPQNPEPVLAFEQFGIIRETFLREAVGEIDVRFQFVHGQHTACFVRLVGAEKQRVHDVVSPVVSGLRDHVVEQTH